MHNFDDDFSAGIDESLFSRVSIPETILLCMDEAVSAISMGKEFSNAVSEFLIQANGKKMPASEVVKIVDVLMTKI